MDEVNQQVDPKAVLKDYDCETSGKIAADETEKELLEENNSDATRSEEVTEPLNANGVDKESEAHSIISSVLESAQSQESGNQKTNTSNENLFSESEFKLSEDFGHCLEGLDENKTVKDVNFSVGSSEKNDSNKSNVSVCEENEENQEQCIQAKSSSPDKISNSHLILSNENDKECDVTDLSGNKFISENEKPVKNNDEISQLKENQEDNINIKEGIPNPEEEKTAENEMDDFSEELGSKNDLIDPLNKVRQENDHETSLKEVIYESKTTESEEKGFNENSSDLKDPETNNVQIGVSDCKTQETDQDNEGTKEDQAIEGTKEDQENEGTKEDQENDGTKEEECEKVILPEASPLHTDREEENSLEDQHHERLKDKTQSNSDLENNAQKQSLENEEMFSNDSPSEVNLRTEAADLQEDKKSDVGDDGKCNDENLETPPVETEKEGAEFEIGQSGVSSTNIELEEEESINKSENEGNEVMDTEIVNCNEIEQIDLSEDETETDLKGNRDEEMVADSLETSCEKSGEDQMADGREESGEAEKNEMLLDEAVNQPGNSEEETITGDTTNQPSSDLSKEKDEEVCIIPDDVIPPLSMLPQNKDVMEEDENPSVPVLTASTPEIVKPKTRTHDKRNQGLDSKARPVRNAAKLAGNKIKSLVESDLVFDEQNLNTDLEGTSEIQENTDESAQVCAQCREVKVCKLLSVQNDNTHYLCSEQCSAAFKMAQMDSENMETDSSLKEYTRKCGHCLSQITNEENRLFWETMDFCNEDCLGKYQLEVGSNCANCKKNVSSTSLGKYCVRFGYNIKQFCSAMCLEEYKKGLKVCSYCQKDISTGAEGFLAPVGSKGQFKDFCTQSCMEKYDRMSSNKPLPEITEACAVCSNSKPVQIEVELDNKTHKLCSEPCFAAFKFVNNITEGHCDMCRKYFDRTKIPDYSLRLLFYDETVHSFCSKTCMNVYILANRKIVRCNWCKVKKYNFDMIKKISSEGQLSMMCSLNCLMLYQTSINAVCSRPLKCDFCKKKFVRQPLYHLTMSDATLRNFCSYNCVMSFQSGYPKQKIDVISGSEPIAGSPIPTGGPKRIAPKRQQVESACVPVISSVQSLASPNGPVSPSGRVQITRGDVNIVSQPLSVPTSPIPAPPPQIYQQIITKPPPAKEMKNKSVLCKPYSHTKGVSCRPHPCMKETQTDQSLNRKFLIPIPVPIYVPAPMHMFATPFPVPVPFPLPIPVPIFIPTTRNSAKGIMKEIKKIQEKIPTDPFEAELLMMAEMVAGDKKQDPTDSESEDGNDGDDHGDGTFSPENVDTSNTFGDDMLQMALKMASELEEPAVDMESVLTSNTITTSTQPTDPNKALYASDNDDPDQVNVMAMNRGRKRSVRGSRSSSGGTPSKRGRRTSGSVDVPLLPPPEPVPPRTIEVEKPDANMCLKYTFGVNAWRHWVMQKNAELEKAALTNRKIKLFKPELLQLTADELNFSLCLFVKEVRKPNGTEYAPDTIYYLCLGIQQYLFENGRIDNIFTDSYYEKFTDCLDEVAKKFAALYNDSQYIVTRVEEEHLWESKQLGAHSPHVLLSTLMFFNTKHFNLVTVEEHMQLSFSHIMKHWKRNPNTPGVAKVPGSRNVLLRFYPPQSALEANSRKKKVYEQQENEENPLRCPVKLYEFYLSKCPESVKTRNDVFYLLPERSCVPDSPVWYSTMALGKEPLMKMLHRIKMVKEINIALLTS